MSSDVNRTILIRAGRLFTGRSPSGVLDDVIVEIDGGVIRGIYGHGDAAAKEAEGRSGVELDAGDYFVMPGLMDVHLHLVGSGDPNPAAPMLEQREYHVLRAQHNASKVLDAGFTTVRDLGAPGYEIIALRDAISNGISRGPRIFAAGRILSETGGHADTPYFNGRICDGVDECRKAVREQIKMRADVIKICTTGGGTSPQDDPMSTQFTIEEIEAMTAEARVKKKRVAAHAENAPGVKNALVGGVDTIEHGVIADRGIFRMMIERGTVFVPTMSAPELIVRNAKGIPEWVIKKVDEQVEVHRKGVQLAHDMGVKVALGTDAGTPYNYHGSNAGELHYLVTYGGFTPGEALYSATGMGAAALGMEAIYGSVEAGKVADVIAIKGDPLQDIKAITDPSNVRLVIKGGKVEKHEDKAI